METWLQDEILAMYGEPTSVDMRACTSAMARLEPIAQKFIEIAKAPVTRIDDDGTLYIKGPKRRRVEIEPEREEGKPLSDEDQEMYLLMQVQTLLRKNGDRVTTPKSVKGDLITCRQSGPRTDPSGKIHKSNTCYFRFSGEGELRYFCHSKDCPREGWPYGCIKLD